MSGSIQFSSSVRNSEYVAGLASSVAPNAIKENVITDLESFITKNSLQFHYLDASYDTYAPQYNSEGYWTRKAAAIPCAAFGIVKAVYHYAMAFFVGIPRICLEERGSPKWMTFNVYVYSVYRDLEESVGRIVTLFDDKMGSYLVQKSAFQKECYSIYHNKPIRPQDCYGSRSYSTIDGMESSLHREANKTTLKEFFAMSPDERKDRIARLELQPSIDALGEEEFFQKLEAANLEVLALASLMDLRQYANQSDERNRQDLIRVFGETGDSQPFFKTSPIPYVLLSDVEFSKLTLKDLEGVSSKQIEIIQKRLSFCEIIPSELLEDLPTDNIMELPLITFYSLSGVQINGIIALI